METSIGSFYGCCICIKLLLLLKERAVFWSSVDVAAELRKFEKRDGGDGRRNLINLGRHDDRNCVD